MAGEGIELEVYSVETPGQLKTVLPGRKAPQFLEQIKAVGGGTFEIANLDPKIRKDPSLIQGRNIIKCKVDGTYVGAMIISGRESTVVDSGGQAMIGKKLSGEGLKQWFADADVYPESGLKTSSKDVRYFNFASLDTGSWYKPTDWINPYNISPVYYNATKWIGYPENWTEWVRQAQWLWGVPGSGAKAIGWNYFRHTINIPQDATYAIYSAADGGFSLYVDGEYLAASDPTVKGYLDTVRTEVELTAGTHVIAYAVQNGVRSTATTGTAGAAGLACAILRIDPDTEEEFYVSKSGAGNWKVLPYPTVAPGWSVGEVLLKLLDEAALRTIRFAEHLNPTFTSTTDSSGNPWPTGLDFEFAIGESMLSVITKIEELGADIWIDPENYDFNVVWNRGEDRSDYIYDTDGVTVLKEPISFYDGKHIRQARTNSRSSIKNHLIAKTDEGWKEFTASPSSHIKYGRVEGTLDTGTSVEVTKLLAENVLSKRSIEEEGASYDLITDKWVPWVDFFPGDWVRAPNEQGVMVPRRILSISVTETEGGQAVYTMEFDTIFKTKEAQFAATINKLTGGGVGTTLANGTASPTIGSGVVVAPPPPNPVKLRPKAPVSVNVTSVGKWTPDGVKPISEVTITWDPVTQNTDDSETVPAWYEIRGRRSTESEDYVQTFGVIGGGLTEVVLQPFDPDSEWVFQVRAISDTAEPGNWSTEVSHTMAGPTTPLPAPDTPTLSSQMGILVIQWNGQLGGLAPAPQFRYVYARVGTSSSGPWTRMGNPMLRDTRQISIPLTTGVEYWVQLIAVDGVGITSAPSVSASHVIAGIDLGDLEGDIQAAIEAAQEAADDAAAAVDVLEDWVAELADGVVLAQTTADGKNRVYRSIAAPTGPFTNGDLWFKLTADGNIDQTNIWNGTTWEPYLFVADSIIVPGSVGSVVIEDGAVTATKVAAGEILAVHIGAAQVDTQHINAEAIIAEHIGAEQIQAIHLAAESITAEKIAAGAIQVNHLSPAFGEELDISANESVNILVGQISGVEGDLDTALNDDETGLRKMQTFYQFGADGARITNPDSAYALALKNDVIQMLENGNIVSYWNSGTMYVDQLQATTVILGNHQIEQYGNGTVIRDL